MTLQEYINTLSKARQFDLAIRLAKLALPVWDNYAEKNELTYSDSIVGLTHTMDRRLLRDTIEAVEKQLSSWAVSPLLFKLRHYFDEPITALQDSDWELPGEVLKIFYAVFNLLEARLGKQTTSSGDLTLYVSINQAVDALESSGSMTFEEIQKIIYN